MILFRTTSVQYFNLVILINFLLSHVPLAFQRDLEQTSRDESVTQHSARAFCLVHGHAKVLRTCARRGAELRFEIDHHQQALCAPVAFLFQETGARQLYRS